MSALLSPTAKRSLLAKRRGTHGAAGAVWVESLPDLIGRLAADWSLTLEPHFASLAYNYVAPVRRADSSPAVLKLCPPQDADALTELEALRCFAGRGCIRLLDSDPSLGASLLQRFDPGLPVSSLQDDAAEVRATASVMRTLWRPPPEDHVFPSIATWFENMATLAAARSERHDWLEAAVTLGRDLVVQPADRLVLLHGDLHHDNVLSSGAGWVCIDPKGVIGEPAWEVGPYLYNNLPDAPGEAAWRRTARRRADQFADELALDRRRVYSCGAVYAALSLSWSLEEGERRGVWFAKRRAVMAELAGF